MRVHPEMVRRGSGPPHWRVRWNGSLTGPHFPTSAQAQAWCDGFAAGHATARQAMKRAVPKEVVTQ